MRAHDTPRRRRDPPAGVRHARVRHLYCERSTADRLSRGDAREAALPHHARRLRRAAREGAQPLRRRLRHGHRPGRGPALPDGVRPQVGDRQPGGDRGPRPARFGRGHAPPVLQRGGARVPLLHAALRPQVAGAGIRRRGERVRRRDLCRHHPGSRAARVLLPADRRAHPGQRTDPHRGALHHRDDRWPRGVQAGCLAHDRRRRRRRAPRGTLRQRRGPPAPPGRAAELPDRAVHAHGCAGRSGGRRRRARRLRGRTLAERPEGADHHPEDRGHQSGARRAHAHPAGVGSARDPVGAGRGSAIAARAAAGARRAAGRSRGRAARLRAGARSEHGSPRPRRGGADAAPRRGAESPLRRLRPLGEQLVGGRARAQRERQRAAVGRSAGGLRQSRTSTGKRTSCPRT